MAIKTTEIQKHVDTVLAQLGAVEITDQATYEQAAELRRKLKQTQKVVDEKLGPIKAERYAPYKEVLDEIKRYTDVISKADGSVRQKMNAYQADQQRKAAEEERKRREAEEAKRLESAIETGREEILDRPVVTEKVAAPTAEGTYTVEVWEYEVTDVSKIKPEFLIVDEKKIGALVRSMKGSAQSILGDGVRVFSRSDVRIRT